jgi:glycosyltransferase involved in cell wall biosynthesis
VCTIKNEADNLAALLDSMLAQRYPPDEIVINDCGSSDDSVAIVEAYAARDSRVRLVRGGWNIPSGRNSAVRAAAGPLIACTDAGLTLDPGWLGAIMTPLEAGQADLVGGFFAPAPRSLFELVLGATNYRHATEIDPDHFLPFGKSMAFRKAAWAAVGGFPEWASHCEDLLFDMALERAGFRRAFAPEAVVHFQPRESLAAFARQYFLYARGDGRAGLWQRRHLLRYGAYLVGAGLLWIAAQPGQQRTHQAIRLATPILLLAGAVGYTRGPYRRLWPQLAGKTIGERVRALALVPIIRVVGDAAKMLGYPVGLWQRPASAPKSPML